MYLRGINYDIGTAYVKGKLSRPEFDEAVIRRELEIIRNGLHCDAVRIYGQDNSRLIRASAIALGQGLQVWLAPIYTDATPEETLEYLSVCAGEAELLRAKNDNLILILGCEFSLFTEGFVRGSTFNDRLKRMFSPAGIVMNLLGLRKGMYKKMNGFMKEAVSGVRERFRGKITYAAGTWEKVNWNLFDFVGIDHYRASYNRSSYARQLARYYRYNKPVAVLEFGCCTYKGAEDKGGAGWGIMEIRDGKPVIRAGYIRDEQVQADYIGDLLDIFLKEKIWAAFVFTFITPVNKYNPDPELDFDMASFGIVKPTDGKQDNSYQGLPWLPKEAFFRLAEYYRRQV